VLKKVSLSLVPNEQELMFRSTSSRESRAELGCWW
jgi:hypothetical protein